MKKNCKYRRLANRRDESIRFMLPSDVKAEIKKRGIHNGRTMSAEVLNRIIDTLIEEDEASANT